MITQTLISTILEKYCLPLNGIHGVSHWARVLENGLRLARHSGADVRIVQLFAIFHDSKRMNESRDDGHGVRGAEFAAQLRRTAFTLSKREFDMLYYACAHHTDGLIEADVTVQTCWDADRLDLLRAGITPQPYKLCTAAARNKQFIDWANQRSVERMVPDFVRAEWGCELG